MGSLVGKEGVKEPEYKVLKKEEYLKNFNANNNYELREYKQFETVGLKMEEGQNKGFMKLARYIGVFGEANNEQNEKLAMTAPVLTTDIN